MIDLEKLSCEEKKTIEELRERLKTDLPAHTFEDNIVLYKFLKARDFNVDKAENMIRKNISWRKHFQVDTILKDFTPRPFFERYIQISNLGFDKNGNILLYVQLGKLDSRDIQKCVQLNEYMKHWVWQFEETAENARKLRKKASKSALQVTFIMDLEKLTLVNATSKPSIEQTVRIMHLLQDNYPESLNSVYVINSPSYYVFLYSILKPLMSSAMVRKIQIFSRSGWKEKLLEVIDSDVLPAFLGGNRTDPDGNPFCVTFVTQAARIPETYYLSEEERDFENRSLVKRVTVAPRQTKEILVHLTESESRIDWEFFIKSKDIGFGLFYKVSDSEFKEILPIERYDTVDGVEKGSYKCHSSGDYFIVFDNSYSWMNWKEVEYCITVLKPLS